MLKQYWVIKVSVLFLVVTSLAFSQDDMSRWRAQLTEKGQQLREIETKISTTQQQLQQVTADHEIAKKNVKDKKDAYDRAKDAYDRGTVNVDIMSSEDLVKLLNAYKSADEEYRSALDREKQLENQQRSLESQIETLTDQKSDKEIQILEIKADMFDAEMSKPVWADGYGESILDENKTMNQCKQLAMTYAEKDAIEKGGKAIIQSVTEIRDFQLQSDEIKTQAKVQVIERDTTGDFGKAIRVDIEQGKIIKYIARVRLELQSIDIYNPFRARIINLRTGGVRSGDAERLSPLVNSFKSMQPKKKHSHTWIYIGSAAVLVAGGTTTYFLLSKKEETQGTLSIRVPLHP
jgi:hypothetical protein